MGYAVYRALTEGEMGGPAHHRAIPTALRECSPPTYSL